MKMITFLIALFAISSAMACPNLTGTYICPASGDEPASTVVLTSSGSNLTYTEDGQTITLTANGSTQTFTNFFNMDVLNVRSTCVGNSFDMNMDGVATIDEGGFQMTLNVLADGTVSLDGSGNLVNTFEVSIPDFGSSQTDSSVCIRQ